MNLQAFSVESFYLRKLFFKFIANGFGVGVYAYGEAETIGKLWRKLLCDHLAIIVIFEYVDK